MNIATVATLSSVPRMTDSPPTVAGSPPSRQWSARAGVGAEVDPAELHQLPGAEVGRERRDEVVADERQPRPRCRRSSPCRASPGRPAAGVATARSPSRSGRAGSAGCASRRARACRPCAASRARTANRATARIAARSRTGSRSGSSGSAGRRRRRSPDCVDQLPKRSKSTNATWLTSRPVRLPDRAERERRAADLVRGVDLRDADLGDLDLEVARDREEREPPLPGVGADEHDRVRAVGALAPGRDAAVGAEHEDRRRRSRRGARRRRQLPPHPGRHAVVSPPRRPARRRGSSRRPTTTSSASEEHEAEERSSASFAAGVAAGRRAAAGVAPSRRVRDGGDVASERHPPLGPAAPVHPVRLVLSGHEAGYGSRAVAPDRVIGVDVGGTKILAGTVARDGTVGRTIEVPTPTTGQEPFLAELEATVEELLADGAGAIGVGVPMNIDRETGIAYRAVNLPLESLDLARSPPRPLLAPGRGRERRQRDGPRRVAPRRRPRRRAT